MKGAEKGTVVTLIAPGGPSRGDWAAVVPCQVPDPGRCPVWPVSEARPRLGDVVQAAADYRDPVPQILARHRQPVAAVIAASILEGMPADGERIDVQSLLEAGGKVTLEYDPGESGSVDSHGDVLYPPERGRANHGGEQSSYLPSPLTRSRQPNDARAERNYPRSGTVSRRRYLKAEPRSIIRNGRVFHPVSQRAPPCWPTASMAQFTNERLPAAHLPAAFPTPFRSPPSLLPPVRPLAGAAGPVGFANGDGGEQAAHGACGRAPAAAGPPRQRQGHPAMAWRGGRGSRGTCRQAPAAAGRQSLRRPAQHQVVVSKEAGGLPGRLGRPERQKGPTPLRRRPQPRLAEVQVQERPGIRYRRLHRSPALPRRVRRAAPRLPRHRRRPRLRKADTGFDNRTLQALHATLARLEGPQPVQPRQAADPAGRALGGAPARRPGRLHRVDRRRAAPPPQLSGLRDDKDPRDVARAALKTRRARRLPGTLYVPGSLVSGGLEAPGGVAGPGRLSRRSSGSQIRRRGGIRRLCAGPLRAGLRG